MGLFGNTLFLKSGSIADKFVSLNSQKLYYNNYFWWAHMTKKHFINTVFIIKYFISSNILIFIFSDITFFPEYLVFFCVPRLRSAELHSSIYLQTYLRYHIEFSYNDIQMDCNILKTLKCLFIIFDFTVWYERVRSLYWVYCTVVGSYRNKNVISDRFVYSA